MTRETVYINTPFIRLSALLKFCGAAETGGQAKDSISRGEVSVDGEVCLISGKKIYPGAVISVGEEEYEVAVL